MSLPAIIVLVAVPQATSVAWGYMATAAALMYLIAYVVAMVAFGLYGMHTRRSMLMLAAGTAGCVAFGYSLYSAVYPTPHYPLNVWMWVGVGVGAVSCAGALALRVGNAR